MWYNHLSVDEIANLILNLDSNLANPYFKGFKSAKAFVNKVKSNMASSENRYLTNKAIEDFTFALNFAKEEGLEFDIFFKDTVVAKRKRQKAANSLKDKQKIKKLRALTFADSFITTIAQETGWSRNTVYKKINQILLEEFSIELSSYTNSLVTLRQCLIKQIINQKKNNTPSWFTIYLLTTEKLHTEEKTQNSNRIFDDFSVPKPRAFEKIE